MPEPPSPQHPSCDLDEEVFGGTPSVELASDSAQTVRSQPRPTRIPSSSGDAESFEPDMTGVDTGDDNRQGESQPRVERMDVDKRRAAQQSVFANMTTVGSLRATPTYASLDESFADSSYLPSGDTEDTPVSSVPDSVSAHLNHSMDMDIGMDTDPAVQVQNQTPSRVYNAETASREPSRLGHSEQDMEDDSFFAQVNHALGA